MDWPRNADMTKREQFIEWLGDAHAMEAGIVNALQKHIADAKGQPKVRALLTKHLRETKRHVAEMKKALNAMGGSRPIVKEGVSKLGSLIAGVVTTVPRDTVVKNAIADFATEHFEIACYQSLIATAGVLGETKIAATCKGILKEETAMAKLLEAQIKEINIAYLATLEGDRAAAPAVKKPAPAKRQSPVRPAGNKSKKSK